MHEKVSGRGLAISCYFLVYFYFRNYWVFSTLHWGNDTVLVVFSSFLLFCPSIAKCAIKLLYQPIYRNSIISRYSRLFCFSYISLCVDVAIQNMKQVLSILKILVKIYFETKPGCNLPNIGIVQKIVPVQFYV